MEIITLLVGLAGGLVIASIVAAVVVRTVRREAAADRAASLETARQAFAAEREASTQQAVDLVIKLAADKLGDQSAAASHELDLRNQLIEERVSTLSAGMAERLDRVATLVADLQKEQAQQRGDLNRKLDEATRQTTDLAVTTQSLRQALASPKARGQWGERMADDVLRMAGLVEGVNYRRQTGVTGGGIPDVTFLLPQGRVLHMDVKFPIDNYVRALEADTEAESKAATAAFLRDVRQRIKELTTRDYIDPASTVEYVLAFIPNESVYSYIHEHDPQMVDHALGQRVVLCSPFSLFAVLAVIRQAMDAYRLERTSDEILDCLGAFHKEWGKFSDQLEKLGRQMESSQKAYFELSGTRRRALERKLDRIEDLRTRHADEPDPGVVRSLRVAPLGDERLAFDEIPDEGFDEDDRVPRSS
ncbi:MAG TPA: DNA recombination protein RmuC [Acidimicrobiales bacterium]|nr:DNA recombination protein RmuC [Acidimicrobiales bacterium]